MENKQRRSRNEAEKKRERSRKEVTKMRLIPGRETEAKAEAKVKAEVSGVAAEMSGVAAPKSA